VRLPAVRWRLRCRDAHSRALNVCLVVQPLMMGVLPPGAFYLALYLGSALLITWLFVYPRVVVYIDAQQSEHTDKAA
jgi:hypothetical protein